MKRFKHIYTLSFLFALITIKCFSQGEAENLIKISESYVDYQQKKSKFNKKNDILIVSAKVIDSSTYFFTICFENIYNLVDFRYDKLYRLNSFKLIIPNGSDKFSLLRLLFKEIPYEDCNKGKIKFEHEVKCWNLTLNKDNEVLTFASPFRTKEVIAILKKHKVTFSKNFKVTRAYPGQ